MASTPLRPTLVRRIPRALILALATALLGGGAIGFATAAGEDGTTFTVPTPMGGDKAVYDIEDVETLGDNTALRHGRIEVRPAAPLVLSDGSVVSAYGLRRGRDAAWVSDGRSTQVMVGWSEAFIDAATDEVVARAYASGSEAGSHTTGIPFTDELPFVSEVGADETYLSSSARREYGPANVPCALRSELQGNAVPIDGFVRVQGCGKKGATVAFHSLGLRPLKGHDSLVLEAGEIGMRLWYQAGIPYPVLYEYDIGTPDEESWRMVGFTPGDQPLVPGPVPAPVQLPAIAQASTSKYGPGLDGFPHPFTVDQAMQEAQARSQVVADFLASHPDWFLRNAEYEQHEQDDMVTGQWSLSLRGGEDELRVEVPQPPAQDTRPPSDADRMLGTLPLEEAPVDAYVPSVSVRDGLHEEPAWPEACRPAALPSIASVAAQWAALERRAALEANAYGFSLWCYGADAEVVPRALVTAGDARFIHPDAPGPASQGEAQKTEQVLTMLLVSGDGEDVELETSNVVLTESWGGNGAPADAEDPEGIQRSSVGAWAVPSKPVAASITFVSILAGVLYWLWPVVKAGPLGLFSRLQAPDLLDHPVRKELLQRIEAQPGLHYQDLVRAMGKGKGAIEHHLRKLQEGGLVKSIASGGYTCFFPVAFDRRLTAAAPALKSAGARKVLAAIQANPGASAMAVGAATGLSPAAVNHHLQRLGAAGLVDVLRNGRSLSIQPTALASQVAAANQEAAAGA